VPTDDHNAIFIGFLRIIGSITQTERHQLANSHSVPLLDIPTLHIAVTKAHLHAMTCRQSRALRSPQARRDFEHVLGSFYHCVMLYGYQTLLSPLSAKLVTNEAADKLFEHLRCIKDMEPFAQDMAWPIFIAGTACCGKLEEQAIVEQKVEEIIRINGPLDRGRMIKFLREWWRRGERESCYESWIEVARKQARNGESFLVF